jgi:hypothetical protein
MEGINSKRILFVTSKPLYPIDGGDKLRAYMFVKYLSTKCKVHVVCPGTISHSMDNVEFHEITTRKYLIPIRLVDLLLKNLPIQLATLDYKRAWRVVGDIYRCEDLIVGHLYRGFFLVPENLRPISFFEACDNFYLAAKRIVFPKSLKSVVFKLDQAKVRKIEKSFLEISQGVSYINIEDAEYYNIKDFVLISNGVLDHCGVVKWSPSNRILLFIGNMNTVPNRDAIDLFLRDNYEFLKKKGLILRVAGIGAHRYEKYDVVEAIGSYSSYEEVSSDVLCGIAPMVNGVGVQNKVLDYLVMALPTLITDVAKSGIDLIDNENCFVITRDSLQAKIEYIQSLGNLEHIEQIRMKGRNTVLTKNSWEHEVDKLWRYWTSLV